MISASLRGNKLRWYGFILTLCRQCVLKNVRVFPSRPSVSHSVPRTKGCPKSVADVSARASPPTERGRDGGEGG